MGRPKTRGESIQNTKQIESDFFKEAFTAIPTGNLVPIIGDTIRNERIFDPDRDANLGIRKRIRHHLKEDNVRINFDRINITEELAFFWVKKINEKAEQLNYPLADSYNLARVAQYLSLFKGGKQTNQDYLDFLKSTLLDEMYEIAEAEDNIEEIAYIEHLGYETDNNILFSQIVTELDLPRHEDPIHMLAKLNLSLYITTSYYDFIERELEAAGKSPRSRLCDWRKFSVSKEHQENDEEPTQESPIVFHLFGMEQYPESMVLSEDDHLDLLWELASNKKRSKKNGESIIPNYVGKRLNSASHPLLLLGYRLHDWDLRVVLRGLLRERNKEDHPNSNSSVALQIDIEKQPLVRDAAQATAYLKEYYDKACLGVEFGDATEFVKDLTTEYYKRF